MWTRGAPLIGATAAYGLCMALRADASDASLDAAHDRLLATRPTAINLKWALDRMVEAVRPLAPEARTAAAYARAAAICDEDVELNRRSEEHTSELQSLMRISYAVFCLKKKKHKHYTHTNTESRHMQII